VPIIDAGATSTSRPGSSLQRPGPGGVAHRAPASSGARAGGAPVALAPVLAAVLLLAWLLADPRTPDLAAQVYRLGLYERGGLGLYDTHWYAGHLLPGYSLLFAPLAALIGWRALAVAAALASAALFERIVSGIYGRSRLVSAGACLFAVAAVGDVWSGRLTFALGVTFACASAYALWRRRSVPAALLAAVCAAASPVAGLLLALAGLTLALARRDPRALAVLAAPVLVVLVPLRVLFPEGGFEPYPATSFAATIVAVGAFLAALPRGADGRLRVLRVGGVVYLVACLLCLVVRTPMGSNVERYGVLLAGPLLLCALGLRRRRPAPSVSAAPLSPSRARLGLGAAAAGAALCAIALWIVWGPVRETAAVVGSPATEVSYYAPVERYLLAHGAALQRVEVPLTRSHWEAALLAPSVPLAGGWEKQLAERYDGVLLGHGLTASSYRAWLDEQAVSYVALPDAPLDGSSAREGALIRGGLPYLRPVFASAHWRVYAVSDPTPLLRGPGRLTRLGSAGFALAAQAPGGFVVRVHYSPYLTVTAGDACAGEAPGGWTYVRARAPGRVEVAARFSLGRALGLDGGSCSTGTRP
jgi:hypothetical protein